MVKILLIIFGVIFIGAAIPFLIKGIRELIIIKSGEIIKARVAELKTTRTRTKHNSTKLLYMPVYEYSENGEIKRFENGVYSGIHKEVGDETTLYKGKNGKIVENRNTGGYVAFGVMFLLCGICAVCGAPTIK